jgi:putative membrane protein
LAFSARTDFLSRKNKKENPMKRAMKVALAAAVCLCLAQVSLAQQERQGTRDQRESDDQRTVSDQDFVRMASSDGLAEIDLGRMAMEQATNPDIKRFAQRVIDDHTKANQELNRTASKMGITPATTVDEKQRKMADRLMQMRGSEFDRAYIHHMVRDHEKTVRLFESEAKHGQNRDLQEFASKTVPSLREHLKMARELDSGRNRGGRDRDK